MLEHLDQQLFLFLNSMHSTFWDPIMVALSGKLIWAPLYLAILIYLGYRYKRKFLVIIGLLALSVLLADQGSVQIFKNTVQRLRPCHEPSLEGLVHIVNGKCGGQFGFVSSHAANSFNIAVVSLLFIRKRWYSISIVLWAIIVGYSRIYLGVHYPGDVICGSLYGILVGWFIYKLYISIDNKILRNKPYFSSGQLT
ncbi:MAG TPA: phosphatase PAP2 family protein [Bacteroidales bacterium]|nr:phosphatase PAP2 family protein [Bacteroidales bacterium]HPT20502.1 phosphatase PAP2 family protein [Bacteroidales bacterium]